MRPYLKAILPSPTTTLLLLVLPILLTIYFTFTRYSERFAAEQNVTYLDVQNGWLGEFLLNQQWLEWFNRFMDFAFWGMLAALVLIAAWSISSTKTAFKNHYAEEEFTNFSETAVSWHRQFFVVLTIRVLLVFTIAFALVSILVRYIPQLSANIVNALPSVTVDSITPVLTSCLIIFCYQYLVVVAVKVFRGLRAD